MIEKKESWMAPIVQFLKDEILLADKTDSKNLKYRTTRYTLQSDSIYIKRFSTPLMKCVNEEDVNYVLREVHGGICGNHNGIMTLA